MNTKSLGASSSTIWCLLQSLLSLQVSFVQDPLLFNFFSLSSLETNLDDDDDKNIINNEGGSGDDDE